MIKAIIFDFDGVILDSAGIKTKAFRKLFQQGHPEKIDAIVNHHVRNMGISRYIKFRYIYENILNLPLSKGQEQELGEKFSRIALDEILKVPFISGVLEFLRENQKKYTMFVVSGTPKEELDYIVKRRGLFDYFQEVRSASTNKSEVIRDIISRHKLGRHEAVFIGDAETDLNAAREAGIHFIAIGNSGCDLLADYKYKIDGFYQLDTLLASIQKGEKP